MNKNFKKYAEHILEYSKIHMLTGFKTEEEINQNLFQDSINAFSEIEIKNKKLLDIGTGCGIPGIPLKLTEPTLNLTLLETLNKRVVFLKEVQKYIDFKLINGRAEENTSKYKEQFDIVTMRAFAHTSICLEIASQFVQQDGLIVLVKGPKAFEEIEESKNAAKLLNLEFIKTIKSVNEKTTITVIYKKIKSTPSEFPRNFGLIKNKKL